jgi:hypothetical protein
VRRLVHHLIRALTPTGPAPVGAHTAVRPGAFGIARVMVRCVAWGTAIGAAAGGIVGAYYVFVGAIFGAPIGAAIGFVVSIPMVPIVVAVCRRSEGEAACREALAETFAALLLVLEAIPILGAERIVVAGAAADLGAVRTFGSAVVAALGVVALSLPPMLAVIVVLRRANRSISDAWYDVPLARLVEVGSW